MKGLTVLSDLMPRHILTSVLWESKPSLGCKFSILGYHHSFPATRLCVTNYHIGAWGPGHGSMLRILSRRQCTDWERAVEMGGWEGRRPQCLDGGFRWLRRPQSRPSFSSAGICFKCMFWQICKTYFILFCFLFIFLWNKMFQLLILFLSLWHCGGSPMAFQGPSMRSSPGDQLSLPGGPGKACRIPPCARRKLKGDSCGPMTSRMMSFPLSTCEWAWIWVAF